MSSRIGIILTLLATIGWFWFCHYWYTCWLEQVCYGCAPVVEEVIREPIDAEAHNAGVFFNTGWDSVRTNVLMGLGANNVLEIRAPYYASETPPAGFDNMGLARAAVIRDSLAAFIPKDRILIKGSLLDGTPPEEGYFGPFRFNWIDRETTPAEPVEEFADKVMIRFPFSSVQREYDPTVDDYLARLAERLKESGETVLLSGHTDNIGGDRNNTILADRRAKMIRDILREKGVSRKQIITKSFGERQPLTTNDTDEGRHNNRRVEIEIIE